MKFPTGLLWIFKLLIATTIASIATTVLMMVAKKIGFADEVRVASTVSYGAGILIGIYVAHLVNKKKEPEKFTSFHQRTMDKMELDALEETYKESLSKEPTKLW